MAASSFDFGYGAPDNFSDWAKYAGFDRKTGTIAAPTDGGIAPPETFGELIDQKVVNPFNKSVENFQAFGSNLSNAATQLGQGNGMAAVNAVRGVKPVLPNQQQPLVAEQPQGWNLSSHVD